MDPVIGSLILAVLTLIAREVRWHRLHIRTRKRLKAAEDERDKLADSLRPKMPPWDDEP